MDSDFTVGFKQGQEHGKEIILEKVEDALADIDAYEADCKYGSDDAFCTGCTETVFNSIRHIIRKHLGEELENETDN